MCSVSTTRNLSHECPFIVPRAEPTIARHDVTRKSFTTIRQIPRWLRSAKKFMEPCIVIVFAFPLSIHLAGIEMTRKPSWFCSVVLTTSQPMRFIARLANTDNSPRKLATIPMPGPTLACYRPHQLLQQLLPTPIS